MENYEQKYNKLVNAIKVLQETNPSDEGIRNWVNDNVPELAEREDERIRKCLITIIKIQKEGSFGLECNHGASWNEMLSWLEKQGEKDKLIQELGEYKVKYTQEVLEKYINSMSNKDDKRLRKTTIAFLEDFAEQGYENAVECIDWLEKQGEQSNNEEAEKEKNDYVSGQFLYCKGSFNEFKEGESYWLEYVGNDNYIGRSDNILNQKFHITPRQLYTWLDPKHAYNGNETNAPTEYGKYVDECLYEASRHFFSEGEDKYSVADLFYAGVRCGKSWLEKQGQKSTWSKEDERIYQSIIDDTVQENQLDDKQISWIKSLKLKRRNSL